MHDDDRRAAGNPRYRSQRLKKEPNRGKTTSSVARLDDLDIDASNVHAR